MDAQRSLAGVKPPVIPTEPRNAPVPRGSSFQRSAEVAQSWLTKPQRSLRASPSRKLESRPPRSPPAA